MISVVVCTHNPKLGTLRRCLVALRAQTLETSSWELLVVDNASKPPVSAGIDLSWHPAARVIREPRLGLTPARLRGIAEAHGDLLVFVDDDNFLDSDFLETAARVADEMAFLGSWSGQCRPEFESDPPEWTRRYWGNLAIREFQGDLWSNLPRLAETMPSGAGMCVRKEVAAHYRHLHDSGARAFQLDRAGDSLMSGGDNDLAACACDLGLGMGLVAALRLTHLIPAARLTPEYLARLVEGIAFSSALLDAERGIPVLGRGAIGRAADAIRLAREKDPHRTILKAAQRGRARAVEALASTHARPALGEEPQR